MYQRYKDRVEFFIIYIREAHPSDGRQMRANERDKVIHKQPETIDQRAAVAKSCLQKLKLSMPFLLDDMKNTTERTYSGWPNRIYVIDLDGKVVMKGPRGPRGADLPGAEAALKALPAKAETAPVPKAE